MAKKTSGPASIEPGQMLEFAAAVLRQLPRDIDPSLAQRWIQNQGDLQRTLREVLMCGQGLPAQHEQTFPPLITPITVVVDYSLSVEEAVKLGKYDWVNDFITQKNFPHDQEQERFDGEIELVHFDQYFRHSDEVLEEFDKLDLWPAYLVELCALGAQHPELQLKFPIAALGSGWTNTERCFVPTIYKHCSGRGLGLDWCDGGWNGSCRFAAVRKRT